MVSQECTRFQQQLPGSSDCGSAGRQVSVNSQHQKCGMMQSSSGFCLLFLEATCCAPGFMPLLAICLPDPQVSVFISRAQSSAKLAAACWDHGQVPQLPTGTAPTSLPADPKGAEELARGCQDCSHTQLHSPCSKGSVLIKDVRVSPGASFSSAWPCLGMSCSRHMPLAWTCTSSV